VRRPEHAIACRSSLCRISAKAAAGLSLSTGNVDIPLGASAGEPPEEIVFTGPKAMLEAQAQWKAWGGKGHARVENRGADGWAAIREAANTGAVPAAPGGNPALANRPLQQGRGPVPAAPSVDRRGLPGRDPVGPHTPLVHTDPEGRSLYQGSLNDPVDYPSPTTRPPLCPRRQPVEQVGVAVHAGARHPRLLPAY